MRKRQANLTKQYGWYFAAFIGLVVMASPSLSFAQADREGRRVTISTPPAGDNPTAVVAYNIDAHLAQWLLSDNEAQFAISRFAAGLAHDDAVQEYAEELEDSHRWFIRQFIRIAVPGEAAGSAPREPAMIRGQRLSELERQRVRATAADEVLEKEEFRPVAETKTAGRGTGQETGPTGTRARDVRQGETGTDTARTIVDPAPRLPRATRSSGPAGVGTQGRTGVAGTTGDELRTHDRRLDAFDRVGNLPVTEQNRRDDDAAETRQLRLRIGRGQVSSNPTAAKLIMEEVARQRIELTKRELSRLDGTAFDKAFLSHQVTAHLYSLSLIRGLKGHVGGELGKLLDRAEDASWIHLDRAQELLEQLDDTSASLP